MSPCRPADPEFAAAEGPSTPPPEDQEFEDDDGTVYQWDRKLRKFQPKGQASIGAEYRVEDMTFEMDEETIPALQMPKEAGFIHLYCLLDRIRKLQALVAWHLQGLIP